MDELLFNIKRLIRAAPAPRVVGCTYSGIFWGMAMYGAPNRAGSLTVDKHDLLKLLMWAQRVIAMRVVRESGGARSTVGTVPVATVPAEVFYSVEGRRVFGERSTLEVVRWVRTVRNEKKVRGGSGLVKLWHRWLRRPCARRWSDGCNWSANPSPFAWCRYTPDISIYIGWQKERRHQAVFSVAQRRTRFSIH